MDLQYVDTCILAMHKVMFFSDCLWRLYTHPLDVGCVRIDNLVLDVWFFLLVVSGSELAVS